MRLLHLGIPMIAFTLVSAPLIHGQSAKEQSKSPLICYVGGTMRPAVEALVKMYQEKTREKIEIDYSSSGEALIKAKMTGRGDLIVVHDPYPGQIDKEKLGAKVWNVATLNGVIVVPKGNPKNIQGLTDLAKPGIKVILTDSNYSTLGHVFGVMLNKAGLKESIYKNTITVTKASGEAANAVALGTGDAAIVWDAVAKLRKDKLDMIQIEKQYRPVPNVDGITSATYGKIDMSTINVAVVALSTSKQKDEALKLGEFMSSGEAKKIWEEQGFEIQETKTEAKVKKTNSVKSEKKK